MIGEQDVTFYNENGYLVVSNVLSADDVAELRQVTEKFVEDARHVSEHNVIYDLEDSHSPAEPRVRRIKTPHAHHEAYARMVAHPNILAVLQKLWGPSIRFDVSKLNLKAAGYGAPVEWHQDWAFYPHSNQDVLAVGIYLDDCGPENGPMMVLPGSHKGPVYDHHAQGYFCGAMDPTQCDLDFEKAVPLMGPAGTMTIHHARLVHGSAYNTSNKPRRFLLQSYAAADAWPLHELKGGLDAYEDRLVRGEQCMRPRMEDVPVRIPLPFRPDATVGSIYDNQSSLANRYFDAAE